MSLADQSQQWFPTSVQVTVLQAKNLRIKGKNGTNDAYAIMQVAKDKFSTSVAEKCVAPVWKEEATFDLPLFHHGNADRCTLHVHVMHRALVGPDKLLGQAVINLLDLEQDKARNKTEWFKLLDKSGKADKERGEVLLNIQFMKNNMTASMFDLSSQEKSRSRMGRLKDKLRSKKKEGLSDSASAVVPSVTQVMTDSEGEEEEREGGDGGATSTPKKKKNKLKSLFAPKSNLQRNTSQSMSTLGPLPERDSALGSSRSSGLNVESPEGKKKFKFLTHKRTGSSDSKSSLGSFSGFGQPKQSGTLPSSNLCINGSHVYAEEAERKPSRASSTFSLTSSGHGSMEELRKSSTPSGNSFTTSVESLRASRSHLQAEDDEEGEQSRRRMREEEEERRRLEDEEEQRLEKERVEREQKRMQEERERMEREAEEERRRNEEEERRRLKEEEEERIRKEEEKRLMEEEQRRAEEERQRKEQERLIEEERQRKEQERLIEEERQRKEQERLIEEERQRKEQERLIEEERRRVEEERMRREQERLMEEERRRAEEERVWKEQQKRQEEEERMRREELEERERMEREKEEERQRMEKERRRVDEEERIRREEEQSREEEQLQEEERRIEEEERLVREERERIWREEEEKLELQRQKEEEMTRGEERSKVEEVEERISVEEQIKKEEERRMLEEEEWVRREKEERERIEREDEEERQRIEEERVRKEEERRLEEEREMNRREEERRKIEREEERAREEQERQKEKERLRAEEEERIKREQEKERRRVEEKRVRMEEEERVRRQEREERLRKEEEERNKREEEKRQMKLEEERMKREEEEDRQKLEEEEERTRLEGERRMKVEQDELRQAEVSVVANPFEDVSSTHLLNESLSTNPFEDSSVEVGSPYDQLSHSSKVSTIKPSFTSVGFPPQTSLTPSNPFLTPDDPEDVFDSVDGSTENLSQAWIPHGDRTEKKRRAPSPPVRKPAPTVPSRTATSGSGAQPHHQAVRDKEGSHRAVDSTSTRQDKRPAPQPPTHLRKSEKTHSVEGTRVGLAVPPGSETIPSSGNEMSISPVPSLASQVFRNALQNYSLTLKGSGKGEKIKSSKSSKVELSVSSQNPDGTDRLNTLESSSIVQTSQTTNPFLEPTVFKHNKGPAPKPRSTHSKISPLKAGPQGGSAPKTDDPEVSQHKETSSMHPYTNSSDVSECPTVEDPKKLDVVESVLVQNAKPEDQSHGEDPGETAYLVMAKAGSVEGTKGHNTAPHSHIKNVPNLPKPDVLANEVSADGSKRVSEKKTRAPLPPANTPKKTQHPKSPDPHSLFVHSDVTAPVEMTPSNPNANAIISVKSAEGGVVVPFVSTTSPSKQRVRLSARVDALPLSTANGTAEDLSKASISTALLSSSTSRRPHAVKPLSAQEPTPAPRTQPKQELTTVGMGQSARTRGATTKAPVSEPKGPYSQLTKEELISLVLHQQEELAQRSSKIQELEEYIDNLVLRVMEEQPSILMSLSSPKKST